MNFIKSIIFLSLAAVDNEDNDPDSTTDNDAVSSTAVTILTTVFYDRTGNDDLDLYFTTVFDDRTGNDDNNYGVLQYQILISSQ